MKLENSKGTRDYPPEEKIVKNQMVDIMRRVFESYGYSPLETPIIEKYELLAAKAGAGQESDAIKEIFTLTDQGGRKLGLKFEQTLSFARFIGMNPGLKMPFKRYETGPVFRDGPVKAGRYRQFWQCDVDIVGSSNMTADAEMIMIALDVFKELGLEAYIEVNNRKLLKGIIEFAGIQKEMADSVIISIDKLKKLGRDGVRKELEQKNIDDEQIARLLSAFELKGSTDEKLSTLDNIIKSKDGQQGLQELKQLFDYFSKEQKKNIVFNASLARGLAYYTGTIFEGFMKKSPVMASICGGGRYDKMISMLINSKEDYPCVGISFGLDVLSEVFKQADKSAGRKTVTEVFIIPIKTIKESFELCQKLRRKGIKADFDHAERGISKNLAYANAYQIPYAVLLGKKELEQDKLKLRNMKTGKEEMLAPDELVKKLRNR